MKWKAKWNEKNWKVSKNLEKNWKVPSMKIFGNWEKNWKIPINKNQFFQNF